jgi:hypothetical protein
MVTVPLSTKQNRIERKEVTLSLLAIRQSSVRCYTITYEMTGMKLEYILLVMAKAKHSTSGHIDLLSIFS